MNAHLEFEPCGCGILRVYEGWNSYRRKSPFKFALPVKRVGNTLLLRALQMDRRLTFQDREAIQAETKRHGFARARWERYRSGKSHPVNLALRKDSPMPVEDTITSAQAHFEKAAELAGSDDIAPAMKKVAELHAALPPDLALDTNVKLGDRLRLLTPLADAIDEVEAAGLAHPDQGHAMHAEMIAGFHDVLDVAEHSFMHLLKAKRAQLPPRG